MKQLAIIACLFLITITTCYGQADKADRLFNYQTFDTDVLSYEPVQRDGVTDQKFNYASRILSDTKSAVKGEPEKLNISDFWNITTAFVILKEPKINIEIAFKKAIALDANSICGYVKAIGTMGLEKIIPETFLPFNNSCTVNINDKKAAFDVKKYAVDHKLNIDLITLINDIRLNDQKFRETKPVDWARQKPLDIRNQQLIDSLYRSCKTYIGKSLVGKELESTMWLVVQHSDIQTMERYLPVVQKAVQEKELDVIPLKMLIDRIYTIKYGYQIFGSQAGVVLADEKTKNAIINKYNLE